MPSRSAAARKLPVSATVTKTTSWESCVRSIDRNIRLSQSLLQHLSSLFASFNLRSSQTQCKQERLMEHRKLGKIEVSAIGTGCMGLSRAYGVQDEAASIRTLHRAIDLGVTSFDTAEVYGPYRNEILLGKALKPYRERVVIATKFGFTYSRDRTDFGEITGTDGRPENAKAVAEASLKRLQTDVIDLYYLHRVDPAVPIEDSVGAMADLVTEGKVRMIGLSEVSAETLRRAHAIHPIAALQSEYSLWTRDVETNGVLEVCRELGITFVPFSPLGRGFLTGKVPAAAELEPGDLRHSLPRFQPATSRRTGDWSR